MKDVRSHSRICHRFSMWRCPWITEVLHDSVNVLASAAATDTNQRVYWSLKISKKGFRKWLPVPFRSACCTLILFTTVKRATYNSPWRITKGPSCLFLSLGISRSYSRSTEVAAVVDNNPEYSSVKYMPSWYNDAGPLIICADKCRVPVLPMHLWVDVKRNEDCMDGRIKEMTVAVPCQLATCPRDCAPRKQVKFPNLSPNIRQNG